MFGIGMPELMVILVVALVIIGPQKLPEIARALGKGYLQFQRAFKEVKGTIDEEIEEIKKEADIPPDNDINKPDFKV